MTPTELPTGLVHLRTTPEFDETSVPKGLLSAHRVAAGVWGRLMVRAGSLDFVFEADPSSARRIGAGEAQIIPPAELHHIALVGQVRFVVEFHGVP